MINRILNRIFKFDLIRIIYGNEHNWRDPNWIKLKDEEYRYIFKRELKEMQNRFGKMMDSIYFDG